MMLVKMSSPSSSRTGVSLTQMEESEPGERGEENLSESPTLRDPRGEEEGEGGGDLYCKCKYVHQMVSFPAHTFEFNNYALCNFSNSTSARAQYGGFTLSCKSIAISLAN